MPDVGAAVRFYCEIFGLGADDVELDGPTAVLRVGDDLRLRVLPEGPPGRSYARGKTPRLKLRVDDVDARLTRWVAAGMTVLARLTDGSDALCAYAQLLDPYGHLWALSRESPGAIAGR